MGFEEQLWVHSASHSQKMPFLQRLQAGFIPACGQSVQFKGHTRGTGKRLPNVSFTMQLTEFPARVVTCPPLSPLLSVPVV